MRRASGCFLRFGKPLVAFAILVALAGAASGQGRRYGKAFLDKFGFTEAQAKKLEQIKSARDAAWEKERTVRHAINKLVNSDQYDEAALTRLADELATLTKANALATAALTHDLYRSLDESQRARWAAHETRDGQQGGRRRAQDADAGNPEPTGHPQP